MAIALTSAVWLSFGAARALAAQSYYFPGSSAVTTTWDNAAGGLNIQTTRISPSQCVDGFFDWHLNNTGHFDVKIVRRCDQGTTAYSNWNNGGNLGGNVTDSNKRGGCNIIGQNIYSLGGSRVNCESTGSIPSNMAYCGEGWGQCLLRSGGVAYQVCWTNPSLTAC